MVFAGVFRLREAHQVVIAQERVNERLAVDGDHVGIPRQAHEAGKGNAPVPPERHNELPGEPFLRQQPEPYDESGKSETDRSLREKGEAARDIGGGIPFLKKREKRGRKSRGERHIRHGGPGDHDKFERRSEDESAGEGDPPGKEPFRRAVHIEHRPRGDQRGRQAGRKGGNTQKGKETASSQ